MDKLVKLIVTDLDGTLFDNLNLNIESYDYAFAAVGMKFDELAYRESFGLSFTDMMNNLNVKDNEIIRRIKEEKSKFYKSNIAKSKINKELFNFLVFSKSIGLKIALATTASKINVDNLLRHNLMLDLFDLIMTSESVKRHKPAPDIYLQIMKSLEVKPCETLIFEDSEVGLRAAIESGAQVININKSINVNEHNGSFGL